jgi:hypothetical protein
MKTKSVSMRAVAALVASLGLGLLLAVPAWPQTPKTAAKAQIQARPENLKAVEWVPPPIIRLGVGEQLPVPLLGQETNVWCWDASSLMVIKYFRPTTSLTECQIATQATPGVSSCCTTPFPTACVHPGWEMLSKNGFSFSSTSTALSWADLKAQISTKKKPVLFAWGWNGGGGHMLVATGWFTLAGQDYVDVNNPWPPTTGAKESYTYAAWVGGPGYDHITWDNWYNIVDTSKIIKVNPNIFREFKVQPVPGPDPLKGKLAVHPEILRRATTTLDAIRTAPPELSRELGFAAGEDAKQAQLGTPLREYSVHLDSLRSYAPKVPAVKLLSGGTTLFYPVVARGVIRSSVRVSAPTPESAKTLSIGDTATAENLQRLESLAPQLRTAGGSPVPAVRIPALGLYFVARPHGGGLEVASIFDVPAYGLKRGSYESLEAVLARLAPIAKALPEGAM